MVATMRDQNPMASFPRFGHGPCLERMTVLCERLGPAHEVALKITGSNGKGSTCAMAAAILESHGLRTGLFTSPHLFDVTERLQINGKPISNADFERWLRIVEGHCVQIAPDTFGAFEILTAMAQGWFAEEGVDAIVWEAGIGGQLDATRVLPCQAAVLVNVSLEHTSILGNSLTQIALDKAQIADSDVPLVLGPLPSDVRQAIQLDRATRGAAPPHDRAVLPADVHVSLAGPHQRDNARCALTACAILLGDAFQAPQAYDALSRTQWPGRFHRIQRDGIEFIVDTAHNMSGIEQVQRTLTECGLGSPHPMVLVVGVSRDRPYDQMVPALAHVATHVICTQAQHKGTAPAVLAQYSHLPTECAETVPQALEMAQQLARSLQAPVLVSGGLFLAAEALCVLQERDLKTLFF
jgi:dihydrofolate synthase/folylpolyglutamate synthase